MLSPQLRVVFWEIVAPWRGKASLETVGHWSVSECCLGPSVFFSLCLLFVQKERACHMFLLL